MQVSIKIGYFAITFHPDFPLWLCIFSQFSAPKMAFSAWKTSEDLDLKWKMQKCWQGGRWIRDEIKLERGTCHSECRLGWIKLQGMVSRNISAPTTSTHMCILMSAPRRLFTGNETLYFPSIMTFLLRVTLQEILSSSSWSLMANDMHARARVWRPLATWYMWWWWQLRQWWLGWRCWRLRWWVWWLY